MPSRRALVSLPLLIVLAVLSSAKDKDKNKDVVPVQVLKAETALVIIDPKAGMQVTNPDANSKAQDDVERALTKWGRIRPVMNGMQPDLIITVRKGSGKTVTPVIGGVPNDRPIVVQSTGEDTRIGAKTPNRPPTGSTTDNTSRPHPTTEVGPADDMFTVYLAGGRDAPLSSPPVWRYIHKDALRSPDVPAVDEFRKLIEKAQKQHP